MVSKTFASALAAALVGSSVVSAQTSTSCNPLEKTCPPDPAFGGVSTCDFTTGACDAFKAAAGTTITYGDKGAVFTINKVTDAPTVESGKYIFFGRIDVLMQAAPMQGVVTSVVLESDDLDEIDLEWVGGDNKQVQTNYFAKGNTKTYNRGGYSPVDNPLGSFHTYSIEWTADAIHWMIDGNTVRTVTPADAKATGNDYPQTPMQIKLGTWNAGGPDSPPGTRDWAGGLTDFSKAPFIAYYKNIKITDYAGGNKPANGGIKQYTYGDRSGSWQSIKVDGGSPSGGDSSSSQAPSSSTKGPDSSKAPESTKAPESSKASESSKTSAAAPSSTPDSSASGSPTTMKTQTPASSSSPPTAVPTNSSGAASRGVIGAAVVAIAFGFAAQLL